MRISSMLALLAGLSFGCGALPVMADGTISNYHGDLARSGSYVVPGLTWAAARTAHRDRSFDGRVQGHIYAQPLYWRPAGAARGVLIVATEANVVQALNADTGAEIWRRVLGRVVPIADLPCGNITPLGVTGTPVIDVPSKSVYLDAFVTQKTGSAQHLVFGLSIADGSVLPGWPVNVASELARRGVSFTPTIQNQRGALALARGRLFVPFGGNAGDCEAYHGMVVGLDIAPTPRVVGAWSTSAQKGGIWSQGALAYDGTSLFTATGNTAGASTWGDGEAIIRLPFTLGHSAATADYFTPSNWLGMDNLDADLGGTGPLPVTLKLRSGGTQPAILGLGKDGNAYVLDRANLGGTGGALLVQHVANGEIINAGATYSVAGTTMVAFGGTGAACPAPVAPPEVVALSITGGTPPVIQTKWCGGFSGGGVPIVTTIDGRADPVVWVVGGEGDDLLRGFRGDTGTALFSGGGPADKAGGARHLGTILAANGRLYVPGDGRIHAFAFTPALH